MNCCSINCPKHFLASLAYGLMMSFFIGGMVAAQPAGTKAIQIPATAVVPDNIPEPTRTDLTKERVVVEANRYMLGEHVNTQNAQCKPAPNTPDGKRACKDRQQRISDEADDLIYMIRNFNQEVLGFTVIAEINAYVKKPNNRWTDAERVRIEKALNALDKDGNDKKSYAEISKVWTDMLARGNEFEAEANKGSGPLMPGAGQQKDFSDCAVFALANASGKPYGFVATQITEMIADGKWRTAAEQKDPQSVFKTGGLMGGEVTLEAEALGRVEVVGSGDFAKTLGGGRTIMVSVFPKGGGAHEVALTKTFQHDGKPWYEMMESYNGPIRRLYLSHTELMAILREKGVAYSPDKGTVIKPLR